MGFEERTTKPKKDNKNYYSTYNYFYPRWENQCTWYVVGRLLELGCKKSDLEKKLPNTNAENWYNDAKYPKQKDAVQGSYIVYSAGKTHHAADGMGHVAFVERVYPDNAIRISESGAKMKFQTRVLYPPYKFYLNVKYKENYKLDGFVNVLGEKVEQYFIVGESYEFKYHKYLRSTPEVKTGNKIKYSALKTQKAKDNCIKDALGFAKTKIGAIMKFDKYKTDKKGNIWARTTNGKGNYVWLCVEDKSGKQVKKV